MNFDRDAFKANFNGLGTPVQFQRLWLAELCNPDSKYLEGPSWLQLQNNDTKVNNWSSVFNGSMIKKESFQGLNYDVWNNANFTTVFSWDANINSNTMYYYHHTKPEN